MRVAGDQQIGARIEQFVERALVGGMHYTDAHRLPGGFAVEFAESLAHLLGIIEVNMRIAQSEHIDVRASQRHALCSVVEIGETQLAVSPGERLGVEVRQTRFGPARFNQIFQRVLHDRRVVVV